MSKEDSYDKKVSRFKDAVKTEKFGKCPKPPPLCSSVSQFDWGGDITKDKGRVRLDINYLSNEEIKYLLEVVRKLGYTPKW
jgi:hypothetical protein